MADVPIHPEHMPRLRELEARGNELLREEHAHLLAARAAQAHLAQLKIELADELATIYGIAVDADPVTIDTSLGVIHTPDRPSTPIRASATVSVHTVD